MSLVSERDGFFGWRQADDPYSLEERGWVEDVWTASLCTMTSSPMGDGIVSDRWIR